MKILIVSPSFRPALTPRSFRWTSLAYQFAKLGHEVHVVTSELPSGVEEPNTDIRVHRVAAPGGKIIAHAETKGTAPKQKKNLLRAVARWFWTTFRWPDHSALWVPGATRKVSNLLATQKFDSVVTVSFPFSGHLPIYFWSLFCKRDFNWIVDVGDPFGFNSSVPVNNRKLYSWLNSYVERSLFRRADYISVTTEETKQEYLSKYSVEAGKYIVIPPLMSFDSLALPDGAAPSSKFKFVFAGTLYSGIRSPAPVLHLVNELRKLAPASEFEFEVYGSAGECSQMLAGQANVHSPLSRDELFKVLASSTALINIGNLTHYQLPSKIIEYMFLRKPILNFYSHDNDSSAASLSMFPLAMNIKVSEIGPAKAQQVLNFLSSPKLLSEDELQRHLKQYKIDSVSNAYFELLESKLR